MLGLNYSRPQLSPAPGITCSLPLPSQERPGLGSGLGRWSRLQSKSPSRGRLESLHSWCVFHNHPVCRRGCFPHPVSGENRKQQLASSQLESAHTEPQIPLPEFQCAGATEKEVAPTSEESRSDEGNDLHTGPLKGGHLCDSCCSGWIRMGAPGSSPIVPCPPQPFPAKTFFGICTRKSGFVLLALKAFSFPPAPSPLSPNVMYLRPVVLGLQSLAIPSFATCQLQHACDSVSLSVKRQAWCMGQCSTNTKFPCGFSLSSLDTQGPLPGCLIM
jgi:hypothetical protein